jgi:WD40 repeat protein
MIALLLEWPRSKPDAEDLEAATSLGRKPRRTLELRTGRSTAGPGGKTLIVREVRAQSKPKTLLQRSRTEINAVCFSPDSLYLAAGLQDGTIHVWSVDRAGPMFGSCVKTLKVRMNCQEVQLEAARGLDRKMAPSGERRVSNETLLEFLTDRGALVNGMH